MMNMGNQTMKERIQTYMEETGRNIKETAEAAGLSRSTLSLYLSGKYESGTESVEEKLSEFLSRSYGYHVARAATEIALSKPEFLETADTDAILSVCQDCQSFAAMGMIIGRPGFGKTYALRRFARLKRVAYVECDDTMSCRDLVEAVQAALGIEALNGSIWKQVNGIRSFFNNNKGWLLIIDEADKLVTRSTQKKMEILRGIYDQSEMGLVLAGEPSLKARVETYLARTANRIEFFLKLGGLSGEEVEAYMSGFDAEPEALEALKQRAMNPRNGCFRLLDRTMNNIIRYMSDSGETRITADMVAEMSLKSLF